VDKGHGRLEIRDYYLFDVSEEYFESRWEKSGFRSLLKVQRNRINLKTNEESTEIAYYISNGKATEEHGYFDAIRNHWSVEVSNHIRDVSLQEDQLRTKKRLFQASWLA
jgi:phosphoribosyl-ATP pyrophosphohydrolase